MAGGMNKVLTLLYPYPSERWSNTQYLWLTSIVPSLPDKANVPLARTAILPTCVPMYFPFGTTARTISPVANPKNCLLRGRYALGNPYLSGNVRAYCPRPVQRTWRISCVRTVAESTAPMHNASKSAKPPGAKRSGHGSSAIRSECGCTL